MRRLHHGVVDRRDPIGRPLTGANSEYSPRIRERRLLGPGLDLAIGLRARPHALAPLDAHRPIRARRVAQPHPPPILRPRSRATRRAARHRHRRLDRDRQLDTVIGDREHHEVGRAEPHRATTVHHQGLPILGPSSSHEIRGGPTLNGGPSPRHHSQLQREGPLNLISSWSTTAAVRSSGPSTGTRSGEPGEAAHAHSHREVLTLDIAGRNEVLIGEVRRLSDRDHGSLRPPTRSCTTSRTSTS